MVASAAVKSSSTVCAICEHLGLPPEQATGTVGLLTAAAGMHGRAIDRLGWAGLEQHIVVHACPEHVVDIYRGRVPGMRMAWRLSTEPSPGFHRDPVAASSSPA